VTATGNSSTAPTAPPARFWPRRLIVLLIVFLAAAAACAAGLVVLRAPLQFEEFTVESSAPIPIERIRLADRDSFRAHFLLLHGYGANRRHLRPLAEVLAAGGADVYLMDLPGRGDHAGPASPRPESGPRADMPTPHETAAALAVLHALEAGLSRETRSGSRDAVPRERLVLVGHSLGGGVAVDVARRTLPAATVSLAGLERPVQPGRPRHLLLITSRLEPPPLRRAADRMHRQSGTAASARREFFGTHSSLPSQSQVQQAILEWAVRTLGAKLETPPWLNEKLLALKFGGLIFLGLAFAPLATLAGFHLAQEPFGEVVSESRISSWSPAHLAGYALLAALATVSALSLVAWFGRPHPLFWLRLADGDYLASVMLLATLWLLPALRHLPWVRDPREVRANLLAALALAAFVLLTAGTWLTWTLFDLWPTTGRWLRMLALFPLLFPYALGEELLRRAFSKQRGKSALSALSAFLLWRLALLAAVVYGSLLLGTGEGMFLLLAGPLLLLSLIEYWLTETLYRALGSVYAAAAFKTLLLAWFFASFFPLR
jgi:pimeloyl-ACP methyl ester carboxylesterase